MWVLLHLFDIYGINLKLTKKRMPDRIRSIFKNKNRVYLRIPT